MFSQRVLGTYMVELMSGIVIMIAESIPSSSI